jgi:hypothetical protein
MEEQFQALLADVKAEFADYKVSMGMQHNDNFWCFIRLATEKRECPVCHGENLQESHYFSAPTFSETLAKIRVDEFIFPTVNDEPPEEPKELTHGLNCKCRACREEYGDYAYHAKKEDLLCDAT